MFIKNIIYKKISIPITIKPNLMSAFFLIPLILLLPWPRYIAVQRVHEFRPGQRFDDHMVGAVGHEKVNILGQRVTGYSCDDEVQQEITRENYT